MINSIGIDGYVRLTLDEVLSVQFAHFMSALDDDDDEAVVYCGAPTSISGYTEWIAKTDPPLSVGWDWVVEPGCGLVQWRRVGPPRTNVMLVDGLIDYDLSVNLDVLSTVVDALPWQDQTRSAIELRYT